MRLCPYSSNDVPLLGSRLAWAVHTSELRPCEERPGRQEEPQQPFMSSCVKSKRPGTNHWLHGMVETYRGQARLGTGPKPLDRVSFAWDLAIFAMICLIIAPSTVLELLGCWLWISVREQPESSPQLSLRGADTHAFPTNDGATILKLLGPLLLLRNSIVSSPALSTGMRRGDCGGAVSRKRNSRHEAQKRSGDVRGLQ